jgi:hypothetical protein
MQFKTTLLLPTLGGLVTLAACADTLPAPDPTQESADEPTQESADESAKVSQTIIYTLRDGTRTQTTKQVTVAVQQAELAERTRLVAQGGVGFWALHTDQSCRGADIWLFDGPNRTGNELCLYRDAYPYFSSADVFDLNTVRRGQLGSANWANAVQSFWAGENPGKLLWCLEGDCEDGGWRHLDFYPYQQMNVPYPNNWNWIALNPPCAPYGAIYTDWISLGGVGSPVGGCLTNEEDDHAGGRIETFISGWIDWFPGQSQGHAVYGAIGHAWLSRYGGTTGIGHPTSDEYSVNHGRMNSFFNTSSNAGAYLVWNPGAGWGTPCSANGDNVCIVYGDIGIHWRANEIGLPVDEEHDDGQGSRIQHFQFGFITWNDNTHHVCLYANDRILYASSNGDCNQVWLGGS